MQIEYGQEDTRQVPSDLLVQFAHRAAVLATLLVALVLGLGALKASASPSLLVARLLASLPTLTWAAVIAADAAVLLAMVGMGIAYYRTRRPLREVLGLLFFTLVLVHLAVWSLVAPGQIAELLQRGYHVLTGPATTAPLAP